MIVVVTVVAAFTIIMSAALIAAAMMGHDSAPCYFKGVNVYVGAYRIPASNCAGPTENVYLSLNEVTESIDGSVFCNGHTKSMLDVADLLARQQ